MPKKIVYIDEDTGDEMYGEILLDHEMAITEEEASILYHHMKDIWVDRTQPYEVAMAVIQRLHDFSSNE